MTNTDQSSSPSEEGSKQATPSRARSGNAGKVIFNDVIEIEMDIPLSEYSNEQVKAYSAKGIGGDTNSYIAMICPSHLTPRSRRGSAYASICGGSMAYLVASGVVLLPGGAGEHYVFIYRDTLGKRVVDSDKNLALGWRPEHVLEKIVAPVISVLRDLRDVDIVHGSIRPSNFYDGGSEKFERIIVGDCLSTPASMMQPAIFEPLHRCTAQPTGRGTGLIEDDLYALGVSIAMFLRTVDPMARASEDEMILNKMQHGTYSTLITKNDRFTGAVLELLRGLLIDDQRQRWNLDDVLSWLDGRRLSPKQLSKRKRANRQLQFNGQGYFYMEAFANDLFKKPAEAVQLIENTELEQWIQRSVDDARALQRLDEAVAAAKETGKSAGYWDRLLSRVSIALDPEGPIRYKTFAIRPEGFGVALGEAFVMNSNLQSFTEILNSPLLPFWLVTCTDMNMDVSDFVSKFETCRNALKQNTIGFGLERCLYFLNESIHCVSPALKGFHVRTPEDLLLAFEKMAASKKARPALTIDRHMAAFLATKDGKTIDRNIYDLNSPERHRRLTGLIHTFASAQKLYSVRELPNLTRWIADEAKILIERFHDKRVRDDLTKKINKIKEKGDISRIAHLLDDSDLTKRDLLRFQLAKQNYQSLSYEYETLEYKLTMPEEYGRSKGRQISVIVSAIVSSIIITGFIIMHINGTSLF